MSEHDSYYGYGENSIVELAESLKFQSQRLDQAKSWAAVIPDAERHIEAIKRRMLELLAPESPQDTDGTETMIIDEASDIDPDKFAEPVQPMADLSGDASGVDWQTGMIKPEVFNGSLPETE